MKSNRGFTLVELIIVVAIIAVLAAVLVPQYLQYVERAKESNDIQIAASVMDAAIVAVGDPRNNVPSGYVVEVAWATDPYHAKQGAIFVRSPVVSSSLAPNPATAPKIPNPEVIYANLDTSISTIMQADPNNLNDAGANDYYKPMIQAAQSKIANLDDFIFHINTETGQVVVTVESRPWVDDLGLNANM